MRRSPKEQEKEKISTKVLISIACLALFPAIYVVGRFLKDFI